MRTSQFLDWLDLSHILLVTTVSLRRLKRFLNREPTWIFVYLKVELYKYSLFVLEITLFEFFFGEFVAACVWSVLVHCGSV